MLPHHLDTAKPPALDWVKSNKNVTTLGFDGSKDRVVNNVLIWGPPHPATANVPPQKSDWNSHTFVLNNVVLS